MYTQCPDCLTVYKVGPDPVASGRGRLRCGHCGTVFDALATLTATLPGEQFEQLPLHAPAGVPPVLDVPAMHPRRTERPREMVAEGQLPGEWLAAADLGDLPSLTADRPVVAVREARSRGLSSERSRAVERSFSPGPPAEPAVHAGGRAPPSYGSGAVADRPSAGWTWACAALALTLLGQVGWLERERIFADPRLRPWLEQACEGLGCSVPLSSSIEGLRLLAREVRPHEHMQGALIISGTLKNDALVPTPFPIVEIRLADLNDRVVAMRRFRPEEYLADRQAIARGFPGQSSLPLLFEVADPGQNALAFEFEFRLP
jgi:predicted Zn finger-like uncharacterized protein